MSKRGKGGKNLLKPPAEQKPSRIQQPDRVSRTTNNLRPIFSFEHLVVGYEVQDCERDEKAFLLDKLRVLSSLTWQQICHASKDTNGYEMIPLSNIQGSISTFLTKDVTQVMVFRFNGSSHRFAGVRQDQVFFFLYIDPKLQLYKH